MVYKRRQTKDNTSPSDCKKTVVETRSAKEKHCEALEKARAARKANMDARDQWLNNRYPWWNDFMAQTDHGRIKIVPSECHIGEEFNGSYIAPEFNQYSLKRSFKGDDAVTKERAYLELRQRKLSEAKGFPSDYLASYFGESMMNQANCRDEQELENYIVDFFRYFKISDINREYKKYLEENKMADDLQAKDAQCEHGKSFFAGMGKWNIIRNINRLNSTSVVPIFEGKVFRRIEVIEKLFYGNRLQTKTHVKKNGGVGFIVIDTETNVHYWLGEEAYNYANHLLNEGGSALRECNFALERDKDLAVQFVFDELKKNAELEESSKQEFDDSGNHTDDEGKEMPF